MELNTTVSNSFSWANVNWDALRRLRARFLEFSESATGSGDYWKSASELESYNFTFAERIGWKWDTVLAELQSRGWTPPEGNFLDWGCGTGVAGRRVTAAWPGQVRKLLLWDRSKPAQNFAVKRARETFPNVVSQVADADAAPDLLVISHVINELGPESLERLLVLAEKAQAVLWVEPGTAAVSRSLIAVRERLVAKFRPVAPCTHALRCGLLASENERHWCHHFANVPREVFQEAGWGRFAKTLEIDLRTVPFSYLVLDRRPAPEAAPNRASRVIGAPRHYKGFDKVLSCQEDGVHELVLQKRDSPELYKEMKKDPGSLYEWDREGEKIRSGRRIF